MKYVLKFSGTILFVLLLSPDSFGQLFSQADERTLFKKQSDMVITDAGTPVYSKMKTDIVAILELNYPKVARRFAFLFPLAENQLWIKEAGSLYVSFLKNGNKISAVFATGGTMNYSITYLKASDIPADIAERIKTSYSSHSIFTVKKITVASEMVYQVVLENSCEYIIISINHDEMEESKKIKKL